MPARVRFVVSAGPALGRGHLARALSLAEAAWPIDSEMELEVLGGARLTQRELERWAAVGGRSIGSDDPLADGTVVVLDVPDPDAVAGRFDQRRLAVFDDREAFTGTAALIVQPSLPSWSGSADAGRVLAGFDYVPVASAIRQRRERGAIAADARPPTVLVCFGGSDPDRVTERLVPAIAQAAGGGASVEVVIGASYLGSTDGWPVEPVRDPPDFVERMATADLVVGGAGTMKFELACLARPMLLLAAADDQRPVGPAFAATGAARYLGDGRTIDPASVADAVRALLADDRARDTLGTTAARVVDGGGAERIARVVAGLGQPAGSS